MNILYVCHRFPFPPQRGGKIRPFNMIKHWHSQGHRLTVASPVRSMAEAREGEGIRDYCEEYLLERIGPYAANARMLARLPTLEPSSLGYFFSPGLKRRIERVLAAKRFDLIFVHCSSVAQYVERVTGIPKVLDFGDMDSQKWLAYATARRFPLSMGYFIEGAKLKRAETAMAKRFDLCTCTTAAEYETLASYRTGVRLGWFPNGVDAEYFAPAKAAYDPDTISFIGRMDYYPNQQAVLQFCADVLPLIRERRPQAKLLVVGASPPARIKTLANAPRVTVTGSVPDVRPYVWESALTIAPLSIARGTQNKVLESMAMGVPVVASPAAARGVDAVPGEHLLTASDPAQLRDAVLKLMSDAQARARLARAGRERILSHHSWSAAMRRLDGLLVECFESFRASGMRAA